MHEGWAIGVVIPVRNESGNISDVIEEIPKWVDAIAIADDYSSDDSKLISTKSLNKRMENGWVGKGWVIDTFPDTTPRRTGVGAAVDAGIQFLASRVEQGGWACNVPWCVAVMDGDGQMNPKELEALVRPIVNGEADYVKGSRVLHSEGLYGMPIIRKLGSWILTHLTNLASGLEISDPQSGYAVTSHEVISTWNWELEWNSYGYPNHRLMILSRASWRICEVPVRSIYNGQKSKLNISSFLPRVAILLWIGLWSRGKEWYLDSRNAESNYHPTTRTKREIFLVFLWFVGWLALLLSPFTLYYGVISKQFGLSLLVLFVFAMVTCRLIDKNFARRRSYEFHQYRRKRVSRL